MATLNIYPAGSGKAAFIGQIEIADDTNNEQLSASSVSKSKGVETIVLLDVSGSMGQNVQRVVTNYLPSALEKVGFSKSDTIKLVTFSDRSKVYTCTIDSLRRSSQRCEGCTYMSPGIRQMASTISGSAFNNIRILAISDGDLHDQLQTIQAANTLATQVKGKKINCIGGLSLVNVVLNIRGMRTPKNSPKPQLGLL